MEPRYKSTIFRTFPLLDLLNKGIFLADIDIFCGKIPTEKNKPFPTFEHHRK
jgi:hypothetical protein